MFNIVKYKLIILCFALLSLCSCNQAIEHCTINKGESDLSLVDFNTNIVQLSGEMFFLWEQLQPAFIDSSNYTLINTKHSWNNQPKGKTNYEMHGFATYFFSITIADKFVGKPFIMQPNHFISYASEIYVNEEMVCNNGSVGKSKNDPKYSPSRKTISKIFIPTSNRLNIRIKVSNFHHFRGGIFEPLTLGLAAQINKNKTQHITYELLIIVSLLIMFLYHLLSHFIFSKNNTALYFAITCLCFALDLSMQNSMCFFFFFPETPFGIHSFLHKASPFVMPAAFIFFFHSFFPEAVSKKVRNIAGMFAVVCIALLFTGSTIISSIAKPHYLYIMLLVAYVYFASVKAIKKKLPGSYLFMASFLFFSLLIANDLLNMFEIVDTPNLISVGMMVFVFFLSIMKAHVNSDMYNQIFQLTNNLKFLNENLENEVERKTRKLNQLLEEEKQLKQFQHDMSNMIVHDLKGPLNTIINVKQVVKDDPGLNTIQQAGYQMNNLVMNILDIYTFNKARPEFIFEDVNLLELLENSCKQVELLVKKKNITIYFDKQLECIVKMDKNAIGRVIVNLLMNASKFSPANKLVKIKVARFAEQEVKISIINSGPPIPAELHEKIFERFIHTTTNKEETIKSTGLGLTYCKLTIEGHKGKIGVNSAPGKEVEFWFTIPNLVSMNYLTQTEQDKDLETLHLTTEEKKYLYSYCKSLNQFEVFDISIINNCLNSIKAKSKNIENWKNQLRKTVEQINASNYTKMLQKVLDE